MSRRFAFAFAFAFAFGLSGCFGGKVAPRELYRLTLPDTLAVPLSGTRRVTAVQGSVAITAYETPGFYGQPYIVYRVNDAEYGAYPSREWAMPLGDMLGMLTERVLREQAFASGGAIYDPPNPRALAYVWHGRVREFDEVDRGKSVYASVAFDAQLVRASDDSVIWTGSVRRERLVEQPSMSGIVATLSDLARECVEELSSEAGRRSD